MQEHYLKTWPDSFQAILDGTKTFEVRKNDRGFAVGDLLFLREWSPVHQRLMGRQMHVRVTYILHGGRFGLPRDMCVMAIVPVDGG